jgi:hypothetical protein
MSILYPGNDVPLHYLSLTSLSLVFLLLLLVAAPLTTPEEAQAFLTSMRDKRKASKVAPPPNLSAGGMDAWYMQQKERERETARRRQEAESLLRGYRMGFTPGQETPSIGRKSAPARTRSLSEKATSMNKVGEAMADPDSDIYERTTLGVQRLSIGGGGPNDTPSKKSATPDEAAIDPAIRQKPMAPPAKTEWRDFVEPGTYISCIMYA